MNQKPIRKLNFQHANTLSNWTAVRYRSKVRSEFVHTVLSYPNVTSIWLKYTLETSNVMRTHNFLKGTEIYSKRRCFPK